MLCLWSKADLPGLASHATFADAIFAALRLLAMSFITCLIAPTSVTSGASILLCFRMLRAACAYLFGIVIKRPLAIASQPLSIGYKT